MVLQRRGRTWWTVGARVVLVLLVLVTTSAFVACGETGDAGDTTPVVALSITSGRLTKTVRTGRVTKVPFAETIIVQAAFDYPIYGLAGQTGAFAEATPTSYRIEPRTPRNRQTFTFALVNRNPGTVEVSIYESRDAQPVTFTLQIGE